ncbi:hypothetical protein ACVRZG_06795 [Streptococcus hyovaginalis]|nr:hypothetical protein [Streptococcus hyovaginalis]QBX08412.1 hypothetical protein JavanS259_0008 [Streptococcus satellite phage Javan259]
MAITRMIEELNEIADYVLSVMTEAEKENYLEMTDQEQRLLIVNHLAKRG